MKSLLIVLLALFSSAFSFEDNAGDVTFYRDGNGGSIVIGTYYNQPGIVCMQDARGNTVHYDLMSPRNQKVTMDAIWDVSNGGPVKLPSGYDRPITFAEQQEGKNGASSSPFGGGGWSFSGLKKKVFKILSGATKKIVSGTSSNVKDGCGQLGEIIGGSYGGTYPVWVDFGKEQFKATSFDAMRNQVSSGFLGELVNN